MFNLQSFLLTISQKICELLDGQAQNLCSFLHSRRYDGFEINCKALPSSSLSTPSYLTDLCIGLNKSKLPDDETKAFFQFLLRHCDRQSGFLSFITCNDPSCRCKKTNRASSLIQSIQTDFHGRLPHPRPFFCSQPDCNHSTQHYDPEQDIVYCASPPSNTEHIDHFTCFSQLFRLKPPGCHPQDRKFCDEHQYSFSSLTDQQRHWKLAHDGVPTKSFLQGQFKCHFLVEAGV